MTVSVSSPTTSAGSVAIGIAASVARPQQILVVIDGRLGHQQPTDDAGGGQRLRDGLATLGQELSSCRRSLRRNSRRADRTAAAEAGGGTIGS